MLRQFLRNKKKNPYPGLAKKKKKRSPPHSTLPISAPGVTISGDTSPHTPSGHVQLRFLHLSLPLSILILNDNSKTFEITQK